MPIKKTTQKLVNTNKIGLISSATWTTQKNSFIFIFISYSKTKVGKFVCGGCFFTFGKIPVSNNFIFR